MTATTDTTAPPRQEPSVDKGGIWIVLGHLHLKIPPLNARLMKKYGADMFSFESKTMVEKMDAVTSIVHEALKRNYPEMALEEVEEALDVTNFRNAFDALMGVSKLERRAVEPGEPVPVPSTGTDSSPSSS